MSLIIIYYFENSFSRIIASLLRTYLRQTWI